MTDKAPYRVKRFSFKKNAQQYRERVLRKIKKFFYGKTLLDVGCADGGDAVLMAGFFRKIKAMDIAKDANWKKIKMRMSVLKIVRSPMRML